MGKVALTKAKATLRKRRWACIGGIYVCAMLGVFLVFGIFDATTDNGRIGVALLALLVATAIIIFGVLQFRSSNLVTLFCEHCGKFISPDEFWKCGYCDTEQRNRAAAWWGLLGHCTTCKRETKAFICPHCQKVNYFDIDRDGSHPASISLSSAPEVDLPATLDIKRQAHLERKTELEHEIEITRLAAQLEELKSSPVFKKEVADQEGALSKRFTQFEKHTIGVHMFAKKKRKEFEEQFKDDPEFLEQMNEALTNFVEEELISTPEEAK